MMMAFPSRPRREVSGYGFRVDARFTRGIRLGATTHKEKDQEDRHRNADQPQQDPADLPALTFVELVELLFHAS
jgi:hypothetical protein